MARVTLVRRPPPPSQQAATIRNAAKEKVREFLEQVQRRHEEYVEPWEVDEDIPLFTIVDESGRDRLVMVVQMDAEDAESASISVWQLLDEGTRVRYMQLSDDWESKTQPGQPFSGPGAGSKIGLDVNAPQLGIAARDIDEMIADEFDPDSVVEGAYTEGFNRNFR